jgi:AcrR family transcriptional regulator
MKEKPIHSITIKSLCQNAQINRSTFYLHYSDQYQLLHELEENIMKETLEHLSNIDSHKDNLKYIESLLLYIKANADIFYVLLCQPNNLTFQSQFVNKVFENIEQSLSFEFNKKERKYIFQFIMKGCHAIIQEWIISNFDTSEKSLTKLIFSLVDNSISLG